MGMATRKRAKLSVNVILDGLIAVVKKNHDAIGDLLQALRATRERTGALPPEADKWVNELVANAARARFGQPDLFTPAAPPHEGGEGPDAAPQEHNPVRGRTHFERVVDYFASVNNRPSSTFEIRRGTGLARGALGMVLYSSHATFFERAGAP